MYLGTLEQKDCWTGRNAPNKHVRITGISGSGKTSRLQQMELVSVYGHKTVIVLDLGHTHSENRIFQPIRREFTSHVNRIDAQTDGIGIHFLEPMASGDGRYESPAGVVNEAANAFAAIHNFGPRQIGAIRNAAIFAINNRGQFPSEMVGIGVGLKAENSYESMAVYELLWMLMNSRVFRDSPKRIEAGKINILDLSGLDSMTRSAAAGLIISYFWRWARWNGAKSDIVLALDEFQNLSFGRGSALPDILREGRKFGVSLLLSTQSTNTFPINIRMLLNQAAVKLYFRPGQHEIPQIAREIAYCYGSKTGEMAKKLAALKVGESIAAGDLRWRDREFQGAVILK